MVELCPEWTQRQDRLLIGPEPEIDESGGKKTIARPDGDGAGYE